MTYLQFQAILITFIMLALVSAFLHANEPIAFQWALFFRQDGGQVKAVDYESGITPLQSGDMIKIYMRPIKNAYIYLFLLDTGENLCLLFPQRVSFFDHYYEWEKTYNFPEGNEWASLDNTTGIEEFILIVSFTRLKRLEKLIISHNKLSLKKDVIAGKLAEIKYSIIEEIQRLKHEHSGFTRKAKEKPVKVAVEMRTTGERQEIPLVEIRADRFYTKTIRILHTH